MKSILQRGLKLSLSLEGFEVETASDGGTAMQLWKSWAPDLIVLDIMLPVIDGVGSAERYKA